MKDTGDMEGMDDMPGMERKKPLRQKPPKAGSQPAGGMHAPSPALPHAHDMSGHTTIPEASAPVARGSMAAPTPATQAMPGGAMHVSLPALAPSARWPATPPPVPHVRYVHDMPPVMDHDTYFHVLMDQLEGRYSAGNSLFRYSGQAWFGTDYNKLWLKSEGLVNGHGTMADGDHELLYDRAISTYFDVQTGLRLDLDSGPVRAWGAVGVQGLALYFFDVSATAYFNNQGVAGKLEGSYDLLITNRLILQPQAELNFYSHADAARDTSTGFSDIDAGLRLRYEFTRKVAPYIAFTYMGHYGDTRGHAAMGRQMPANGPEDLRFTFGIRTWY
ncbi:copper resistance protein B [Acetobacter sp. TBRC 12305]|uniref:Copper resistance protein B n=2 Tax=Acetobacter garciniae TaxID=2817435 RepID=A0A939HRI4_9PROT|nr:copper resistance protein B [Acetobacter garciniae]MBX0346144.1 copper resistance protein B [Acetobacter garciniae]